METRKFQTGTWKSPTPDEFHVEEAIAAGLMVMVAIVTLPLWLPFWVYWFFTK